MSPALFALGRSCYRRPGRVAAAWLIVAVLLAALAGLVGKGTSEQYTVPGSESQAALDDLHALCPEMAGASGPIVLVAPPGQRLETPAVTEAVAAELGVTSRTVRRHATASFAALRAREWCLS